MITKESLQVFKIIIIIFILISILFWIISYLGKTEVLDHYGSFIGGLLGTILSFLSVILVVYSLHDQKMNEENKQNEYLNDKLIYLHNIVSHSIEFTQSLSKTLVEFSETLSKKSIDFPILNMYIVSNNIERLVKKLNEEEYYLAYKKLIKDEDIINIFNTCDIVYEEYILIKEQIQKSQIFDFEKKDKLVEEIKLLIDNIDNDLKSIQNGINFIEFQKLFSYLLRKYDEIVNLNHDDFKSIQSEILDVLINRTNNTKYAHLAEKASRINRMIYPIEKNNENLSRNVKEIADNLTKYHLYIEKNFIKLDHYIGLVQKTKALKL